MNPIKELIRDMALGTIGLVNIAFGAFIFINSPCPLIKLMAFTIAFAGATGIYIGRG